MLSSSVAKDAYSFRSSTGETETVNFYEFEGNLVYLHRKIQANQGYTMRSSLKSEGPLAEMWQAPVTPTALSDYFLWLQGWSRNACIYT